MAKKVATLEKVSKTYGKDDLMVKALDNVNLEIYKGDYLAVMGASGSGKSTAMNIIGLPPLRVALYTCIAVTALGGILSNPLFKLANSAVSETPFLQDILAVSHNAL